MMISVPLQCMNRFDVWCLFFQDLFCNRPGIPGDRLQVGEGGVDLGGGRQEQILYRSPDSRDEMGTVQGVQGLDELITVYQEIADGAAVEV
jgi:hypothetical protein